ncbi:hypothetical protein ACFZAD_24440 [Streptomyces iakyrus]|uniref:hypothetical protein n=1 Tax=Streptomyces iakyrus TaxID=68219 RepID=UPI0036E983B3
MSSEFRDEVAKVVKGAVGGLNHTNIGYAPGHDYLADPYIDEIMTLIGHRDQQIALAARIEGAEEMFGIILPETQFADPGNDSDFIRVNVEGAHISKNRYIATLKRKAQKEE